MDCLKLKIEKVFAINAAQQTVWDFITTPEKIGPCIPGCEDIEIAGPGKYRAAIKLQAGPIKTTFYVTVIATEERPPEFASYTTQGDEGDKASRINAKSTLTVTPLGTEQSEISYACDINISGRLGKFSAGVMTKIADKMSEKFIVALRAGIDSRVI